MWGFLFVRFKNLPALTGGKAKLYNYKKYKN